MNVNISELNRWMECRYAGTFMHNEQKWGRPSDAMLLGKALHKHMEWILNGRHDEQPAAPLEYVDDIEPLREAARKWDGTFRFSPIKVIEVEKPFAIPLGEHTLNGTLDALVLWNKKQWSLQWKTVAKGKPIGLELEKIRMSPHELAYHYAMRHTHKIELAGTLLGTFKKLTKKDLLEGTDPFNMQELYRKPTEVDHFIEHDLIPLVELFAKDCTSTHAPRNWRACYGPFGNSQCPIFDHCHSGIPKEQLHLYDMEKRY